MNKNIFRRVMSGLLSVTLLSTPVLVDKSFAMRTGLHNMIYDGQIQGIMNVLRNCNQMEGFLQFLNERDNNGETVLQIALRFGLIDTQDDQGNTMLHIAAESGNILLVMQLLDMGANASLQNNEGETPIQIVARLGLIDTQDNQGNTMLHFAIERNDALLAQALVNNGANILLQNEMGDAAIHMATRLHRIPLLALMLSNRMDMINQPNLNGDTMLHIAAEQDDVELVQILIQNEANINSLNLHNETPIHVAIRSLSQNVQDFLIGNGANLMAVNGEGQTPLHMAVLQGDVNIIQSLIDSERVYDIQNQEGDTALNIACRIASQAMDEEAFTVAQQMIRSLLLGEASAEIENSEGNRPLDIVMSSPRSRDILRTFLDAEFDHGDERGGRSAFSEGRLLIHALASRRDIDARMANWIVNELYSHESGAQEDLYTEDDYGFTPLRIAAISGAVNMLRALVDRQMEDA